MKERGLYFSLATHVGTHSQICWFNKTGTDLKQNDINVVSQGANEFVFNDCFGLVKAL